MTFNKLRLSNAKLVSTEHLPSWSTRYSSQKALNRHISEKHSDKIVKVGFKCQSGEEINHEDLYEGLDAEEIGIEAYPEF